MNTLLNNHRKEEKTMFKKGNTVIYTNADGLEKEAIIEAIIPPAIHPVSQAEYLGINLTKFNSKLVGGAVRETESYLISLDWDSPKKNYRDGNPTKQRYLLWPKVSHLRLKPVVVAKENSKRRANNA